MPFSPFQAHLTNPQRALGQRSPHTVKKDIDDKSLVPSKTDIQGLNVGGIVGGGGGGPPIVVVVVGSIVVVVGAMVVVVVGIIVVVVVGIIVVVVGIMVVVVGLTPKTEVALSHIANLQ